MLFRVQRYLSVVRCASQAMSKRSQSELAVEVVPGALSTQSQNLVEHPGSTSVQMAVPVSLPSLCWGRAPRVLRPFGINT